MRTQTSSTGPDWGLGNYEPIAAQLLPVAARVVDQAAPRQGDQLWYVSDTAKLAAATGWRATIRWQEGLADLMAWLEELQARGRQAVQSELRSANA